MKLLTSRIESGDKSGIQDLLQRMNVLTWFTELSHQWQKLWQKCFYDVPLKPTIKSHRAH